MKAIVICDRGIEDVACSEVKNILGVSCKIKNTVVQFSASTEEIIMLGYKAQSIRRVLALFCEFSFKDNFFELLKKNLQKIDFSSFIHDSTKFMAECERIGEHKFNSEDVKAFTGEQVIENVFKNSKFRPDVDLIRPDCMVFVYIFDNSCYVGIDMMGVNLSKRDYRLFTHPSSIKGSIAYALSQIAGYDREKIMLDPFCNSGELCIEAALFGIGKSAHFYNKEKFAFPGTLKMDTKFLEKLDEETNEGKLKITGYDRFMPHVVSCNKNSKLAGVNKFINFSRVEIEWLDTKLKENEIDLIVSCPPDHTKRSDNKEVEKIHKELFYQGAYVLKKKGKMVLMVRSRDSFMKYAEQFKFMLKDERKIWQGKQEYDVLIFEK